MAQNPAQQLSDLERKTLAVLAENETISVEELPAKTGLHPDSVRRALQWLSQKELLALDSDTQTAYQLTPSGKSSQRNGLPEQLFVSALTALEGRAPLEDVFRQSQLNRPEFNAAMGLAKKNAWISMTKDDAQVILSLTGLEKDVISGKLETQQALAAISENKPLTASAQTIETLLRRGLIETKTTTRQQVRVTAKGHAALAALPSVSKRVYDVSAPAPPLLMGKKQPYAQFVTRLSRRLTELGFVEMPTPLITQEFYNFDVLFQPQNHPARSWTDTYQLKTPTKGALPAGLIVRAVKAMHETGGVSASSGWQYSWEQEIASRLMPAAHTTAHSARQLVRGISTPGKYFAIARCFRPDVVDATHLIEFNQMEGFIVGKGLHFRHLLGMLRQFAVEFTHTDQIRFAPSYYPFTEPSVQLNVKHPVLGWMELGGAGMFRPEMLENLNIKTQALAWGIGIDRLAMLSLGINDIRYLFSDDLNWLRAQPGVLRTSTEAK